LLFLQKEDPPLPFDQRREAERCGGRDEDARVDKPSAVSWLDRGVPKVDRPMNVLEVFPLPVDGYHHATSSERTRREKAGELMNRRRFSTPFLLSLALHAAVALVLSVVVVHQRAELVESFTAEVVSAPTPKTKPRLISRRELVRPVPTTTPFRTTDTPQWNPPNAPLTPGTVPTSVVLSNDAPSPLLTTPLHDATPTLNVPLRPVAPSLRVEPAEKVLPTARVDEVAPAKPDQPLAGLSSVLLTGVEEAEASTISPEYLAAIRKRIERHQKYPRLARERGIEGTATVRFTLNRSGHLEELVLVSSSGSKTLDDAALTAIRESAPFPPFPESQRGARLRIQLPIVFQLTSGRP